MEKVVPKEVPDRGRGSGAVGQFQPCSGSVLGAEPFRQAAGGIWAAPRLLRVPVTGVLLHIPIAAVLLHLPIAGLLPHVPVGGVLWCSSGAYWLHPSARSPQLPSAGAEEVLMGPWLVPRALQQLPSLMACHNSPFQWTTLSSSAWQDPSALAQQIQPPRCGQLFPTPRPAKMPFASPRNQPAIFMAGEKAAAEEGGDRAGQSSAEPQGRCINMQSSMPARRRPDGV